jgi:hypothetical protein
MYTRRKKKTRERISKKEKSFFLYSSEEAQKIFLSLFAFLSLRPARASPMQLPSTTTRAMTAIMIVS